VRIQALQVRFFRSFNYDYELKFRKRDAPAPSWEVTDLGWFPFVRVDLEPRITAVVGANEAGKSQLLSAITAALTGDGIKRTDFCRYSALYTVQDEIPRLPEFGLDLVIEPDQDDVAGITELQGVAAFSLFRPGVGDPFLVVNGQERPLAKESLDKLENALPQFHSLETSLAIPDSVSIGALAGESQDALHNRKRRLAFLRTVRGAESLVEPETTRALTALLTHGDDEANDEVLRRRAAEFELARQLLVDAAKIKPAHFKDLKEALASEEEGQVEAIVGAMNAAIKENLNIHRWWSQDRDFDLRVEAREHELAFTIRDRTGSKYSFKERSQGLRFFLSYFVQLLAHRIQHGKPDLLLLDEPDAFLSSVGQQDLLRVLQEYALPEDGSSPSQVVYVTHSPFLIDKNSPHVIRVLDKGSEDEGTRVVHDAANNRYEPLRSSIGAYVSETAFIGGSNLFVEGPVDQLLITGLSTHIGRVDPASPGVLDLNSITVVAAGGADGVPYLVYLARGRDSLKPPCVALLDGDKAGRDAERVLKRGEARKKRVLKDEYVVRLDLWAEKSGLTFDDGVVVREIEDLIPLPLLHRAGLNYLSRFQDLAEVSSAGFTTELIRDKLSDHDGRTWEALNDAFTSTFPDEHLEKVGVAREVLNVIDIDPQIEGAETLRARFALLTADLLEKLEAAFLDENINRDEDRFARAVASFQSTYANGISKYDARRVLRELDILLGEGPHTDRVRSVLQRLQREYELASAGPPVVARFDDFRDEVIALATFERLAYQDDARIDPAAAVLPSREVEPVEQPTTSARKRPRRAGGAVARDNASGEGS
jgi:predicted ATPase